MIRYLIALSLALMPLSAETFYLTVAGLGGEPDYSQRFSGWAKDIDKLLQSTPASQVKTLDGDAATRDSIRREIEAIAGRAKPDDVLVVMMIGHGSFDGLDYKFNIPGPDITASEMARLLDRVPANRQLIVSLTSASGAAIDALRKPNRAVVTATRSGTERNAVVFPRYWVEALRDASADADKNEVVSALEAFRFADQKTIKFYETQKRLATEHALLEDTGQADGVRNPSAENGQGLLAARFPLIRLGAAQQAMRDPAKQKLLARKEELESEVDKLKYQKAAIPGDEYKKQISALLLELARTQAELDK